MTGWGKCPTSDFLQQVLEVCRSALLVASLIGRWSVLRRVVKDVASPGNTSCLRVRNRMATSSAQCCCNRMRKSGALLDHVSGEDAEQLFWAIRSNRDYVIARQVDRHAPPTLNCIREMSVDFCADAPMEDPFGGRNWPHVAFANLGEGNGSLREWRKSDPQTLLVYVGHQSGSSQQERNANADHRPEQGDHPGGSRIDVVDVAKDHTIYGSRPGEGGQHGGQHEDGRPSDDLNLVKARHGPSWPREGSLGQGPNVPNGPS
jgi:hypothetical protein